jgi:hypothetical protein
VECTLKRELLTKYIEASTSYHRLTRRLANDQAKGGCAELMLQANAAWHECLRLNAELRQHCEKHHC